MALRYLVYVMQCFQRAVQTRAKALSNGSTLFGIRNAMFPACCTDEGIGSWQIG